MKSFPLLIEVYKMSTEESDQCANEDCCGGWFEYESCDIEGQYIVESFDDFPSSEYVVKIIEYNTPSVAHPVWR